MTRSRQPTAFVFCVADHPVFEALLTVCREIAASGRGLRSADDYRRWWYVVVAQAHRDRVKLPPDEPGLEDEEFIPGFVEGVAQLLAGLDGADDIVPIVGDKRPWYVYSHARLTHEPLEDYLRERGFEVLRTRDLLARERNRWRPSSGNDVFAYQASIADALSNAELTLIEDDRIAFAYVLGELEQLPPGILASPAFFESVPELPHPNDWSLHDHRHFDVLCAARAFERLPSGLYDVAWAESYHAWARELERRRAPRLHAVRTIIDRVRSLAEDIELVGASVAVRKTWTGDARMLERELQKAKRSLVASCKGLVFAGIKAAPPAEAAPTIAALPRPRSIEQLHQALGAGSYDLCSAWGRDQLLIVFGYPYLALRSIDAGGTWTLGQLPLDRPHAMDGARLDDGRELIVVVGSSGVAWSWDRGESWDAMQTRRPFDAVAVAPDGRVCAVGPRVWALANDPAELHPIEARMMFEDVTFDGSRFLAVAIDGSVLALERDGWRQLVRLDARTMAIAARDDLLMVLADQGYATSIDGGQRWTWTTDDRLLCAQAAAITPDGRRFLIADRVLSSEDGQRWQIEHIADGLHARDVAATEHAVVITSWSSVALVSRESSTALRFGSTELATCPEHYPLAEHGFTPATLVPGSDITALFAASDRLLLATDKSLLLSDDRGLTFVPAAAPRGQPVSSIVEYDGELWAACGGVLRSVDGGRSWVAVEAPQVTKLLVSARGELFAVSGEWLLRRDPRERSGWRTCRRFEYPIERLVSVASGTLYLVAFDLHASDDGGETWRVSAFDHAIIGLVASSDGLLAFDRQRRHVSHDQGRSFESHPLPLYVDARWRGQVMSFCGSASGDLYFSTHHFLLHSTDGGRTLARVPSPFANTFYSIRSVVEHAGRQYMLLESKQLLERVAASEVPEPRFIEVVP